MEPMARNVTREEKGFWLTKGTCCMTAIASTVRYHYELHYHQERNHQGKGNLLLFPSPPRTMNLKLGKVRRRERLGTLLKYYAREAT
jgi:hypothetical protein